MQRARRPSSLTEPSSSPRTFGLTRVMRHPGSGTPRAQRPFLKGKLHYLRPSILVAFSLGPDPWLPRSSQAQHLCLSPEPASASVAPLVATSSVLEKEERAG